MAVFKSLKTSVTFPFTLVALIRRRAKDLGYKSVSAYLLGLILFDLWAKQPHRLTHQIVNEDSEALREAVYREIVESYDRPEKPRGYFEHRVRELASELAEKEREG